MVTTGEKLKALFISTYPPRKCGIASFTQDLATAISPYISPEMSIDICALDKTEKARFYDNDVTMVMDSFNLDSLMGTARKINNDSSIKLVCIEHEFGLFGGEMGEYLLGFLSLLEKPFIVRFHTILPSPCNKRLKIVQAIGLLAQQLSPRRLLSHSYGLAQIEEAYELFSEQRDGVLKIAIHPWTKLAPAFAVLGPLLLHAASSLADPAATTTLVAQVVPARAPERIEGLYTLVKTVAHAAPVRTLEPLDIKSAPEHYNTQCNDTQEAEVYPPQYVTFYFQCPRLTRPSFAGIVISVPVRCSCSLFLFVISIRNSCS